jgi:PAS domain S-box-containing protein
MGVRLTRLVQSIASRHNAIRDVRADMNQLVRLLSILSGVAVLYFAAGRLGLSLAYVNADVTAIWPPAGIAVAALLVIGVRAWPALAIGAFLTNLTVLDAVGPSLAIAAGNTLEYLAAAALATRFAHGRFAFDRGTDLFRFALSALAAPVVAATIGTITLRAYGLAPAADTTMVWFTWWLGDASGIVLFAPVCVLWTAGRLRMRAGLAESVTLAAALAGVLFLVFGAWSDALRNLPLAVLMLPLLLWSAVRFNTATTATLSVVMSVIAVYRILHDFGPFTLGEPDVSLLIVQSIVALVSLLVLSVAAEVSARRRVEGDLRLLNDTLERRVAERTAELTRVHDRLVDAQTVALVGSWEWNVLEDSVWWSDELCRIFGVTKSPPTYEGFLSLVHPEDRERASAAVSEAGRTGQPFSFDHRIVRPDGGLRFIHSRGRVEMDEAGRAIRMLGIGHDVTERKQAEEARAQLFSEQAKLREAEGANNAKDAFLATLSHELRTPLNAALGWAHILRDSMRAEGRDDRAVQAIYRNLLLQSQLVSDILDVSRIVRGELPLERARVDMASVFEDALDTVREAAETRRVRVDITTVGSTDVVGDARRLHQVAWNLLSNAVKFAADGGDVRVSILEGPEWVECAVEDDGPGIAPDFLPHMFEQFRQADSSVTRKHGGLGLGLAIAQEIVRRHEGVISAANRAGGGAVLTVRLPRWRTEGSVTLTLEV